MWNQGSALALGFTLLVDGAENTNWKFPPLLFVHQHVNAVSLI